MWARRKKKKQRAIISTYNKGTKQFIKNYINSIWSGRNIGLIEGTLTYS